MTPAAISLTGHATGPEPKVWDTGDVTASEAFDYYREGICAVFMPLRPELPRAARLDFRAVVRSYAMPEGALNLVSARAHDVLRTRAEIAASPEPCHYVNLQIDGICEIAQAGRTLSLHPGEVALFDSDSSLVLDHRRRPGVRVASLLVPKRLVGADVAPGPHRLSDHPLFGGLIIEAARALTAGAETQAQTEPLHQLFLTLVALSVNESAVEPSTRADGQFLRIMAAIRTNAARPDWGLADCAANLSMAPRSIQRALAAKGEGFAAALTRARMERAARLLRDPSQAHRPVAEIALLSGYSDAASLCRSFRAARGVPPGAWRRGEA